MKKQSGLAEFFKSKSFYALLCVGTLAIIAMLLVGLNRPSDDENNMVDLNEPMVAQVEQSEETELSHDSSNPISSDIVNIPSDIRGEIAKTDEDGFYVGESRPEDVYENDALISSVNPLETEENAMNVEDGTEVALETQAEPEPAKEVMKPEALHFDEESVLLWPVAGDIVSKFGRQLDPTTKTSRVNEGIAISANIGDSVKASVAGIVTDIMNDDRTGLTMKVSVGNGYTVTYGQLKDITVQVGDYVETGSVIAKVEDSTKFYSQQGNNVYLQLTKDEIAENPEIYLSSEK